MASAIVLFRFGIPLFRSVQDNLVVDKVIIEGPGVTWIVMRGRKLRGLGAEGAQIIKWRFLACGHFLMSHPYSLSAALTEKHLRITVKDLGDYSGSVDLLKALTGAFTAGKETQPHKVLIGGGVGITDLCP
jgi:ferredoxin-NADP reductase